MNQEYVRTIGTYVCVPFAAIQFCQYQKCHIFSVLSAGYTKPITVETAYIFTCSSGCWHHNSEQTTAQTNACQSIIKARLLL